VSVVANVAINVDSSGAVSKLRQVQTQAQSTEKAFGGVAAAVGKLAVAFGAIQAAKFVFAKTAELESQTRSLQVLTGSAEKAGQIIKELQQLGAVTPFTSTELIDSAKRLQAFGVEADKVVETTRRLADASGATGAELSGLVTAYGQVQAKGRLQGEELLQFQERGIGLQQELRNMYGMTGEEFQKALEKGQISAKAVEVALVNLTSVGGKYANGAIAQSDTLQGRLSTLQDGIDGLARGIGTALSPAIKAVLNEAIFAINLINQLIATGARAKSFGLGDSQRKQILNQAQTEAQQIVEGRRIKDPFERNRQFQELAGQRERDLIETYGYRTGQVKPAATAPQMATQVPGLLGATAGGGGGGRAAGGGGASKAADDAKRLAEQMQQQLKAADDINFALKNRLAIAQETEPVAKRMLEYDVRQNEIAKEYDELKKAAKGADELALINANLVIENRIAQIEAEQEINDLLAERATLVADLVRASSMPTVYNELETQDAALQAILDKYPAIGAAADAAATMATSGISEMIAGTKSAEQVFVEFLNAIADALINTAKQMIAQYIAIGIAKMFAGLGGGGGGGFAPSGPLAAVGNVNTDVSGFFAPSAKGNAFGANGIIPFAKGGIVNSPTLFPFAKGTGLMGEAGPEAIMPLKRGPDGSLGVQANGLRDAMDRDRSGTNNGAPVLNMSFQSTNIAGVEYVSRDQLEQAMFETRRQASRDGAKRGMSMTLDKLQQSPSTRRRVGI
jgi:tape measure domain-containing protein